jgi:ribonuclease P protein component
MRMPSLAAPRDFQRVLSEGRRVRARGVQVSVAPREAPDLPTRLGLAVRAPGAVVRNRARRRLRAVATGCAPRLGWDVVLGAGREAAELPSLELEETVCSAIRGLAR